MIKAFGASVFSGSLTGMFPGLGAAQAAIIASNITGRIGMYSFMVLVGGINTVNFLFSLVTLLVLNKARNGAILVINKLLGDIDLTVMIVFLFTALVVVGIATFLAVRISKIFCKYIVRVNYKALVCSIMGFITILTIYFDGMIGLLVLIVSTSIGLIASEIGVGKNHLMGCLILPVILFFVV